MMKNDINQRDLFWLSFGIWFSALFLDSKLFGKLYFTDLLLGVLLLVFGFRILTSSVGLKSLLGFISCILILPVLSYWIQGHFMPGAVYAWSKLFLLFVGGICISKVWSSRITLNFLSAYPFVLLLFLVYKYVSGIPTGVFGRFGLYESLGSPNTVGFLIAFAFLLLLFTRFTGFFRYCKYLIMLVLIVFLGFTFSRSAILGLVLGALYAYILSNYAIKQKIIYIVSAFAIIFLVFLLVLHIHFGHHFYQNDLLRFNIFSGSLNKFSSGRLHIWSVLLHHYMSTPAIWLTGFGPGVASGLNINGVAYNSYDSFLILALYSYGPIGLMLALWFCIRLCFIGKRGYKHFLMKRALGAFLCFTLLVSDITNVSYLILYGALIIGFLFGHDDVEL